jgi:hypothetical protein
MSLSPQHLLGGAVSHSPGVHIPLWDCPAWTNRVSVKVGQAQAWMVTVADIGHPFDRLDTVKCRP